ncbi:MAG: methionyl-tRNA formyltransferase, partial [Pseudonocardiales bacterium]|nr:methionyl-tRNA formyltransferase [Pseudonocardiales bacterium]
DAPHNLYLEAILQNNFEVVGVVVEPGLEQRRSLLSRRRWLDYGYALYHDGRRSILGLSAYRSTFFGKVPDVPPQRLSPTLKTPSVNDVKVQLWLREASPDVVVVTCTSVLNRETIDAAGDTILNIHGGYLPDYRGWYGFFFALYEGKPELVGSTIHFIDASIDTGDIVEVVKPPIHAGDGPEQLYCRAERRAAHRLVELLADLEQGKPLNRMPQPYRRKLYLRRDRTPVHDLIFLFRRMRSKLGPTPSGSRWRDVS